MVDWNSVQKQRDRERARARTKVNIIGFNIDRRYKWQADGWVEPEKTYRTCPYHHCILIPKQGEKDMLQCPECGTCFLEKDTGIEEEVKGTHKKQQTKIVQGRNRKKKYFDEQGNEITDPLLIQDILQGKTVQYYHEEKSGEKDAHINVRR